MTRDDLKQLVIMRHGEADFPRDAPDGRPSARARGARRPWRRVRGWRVTHCPRCTGLAGPAHPTNGHAGRARSSGRGAPTPQLWTRAERLGRAAARRGQPGAESVCTLLVVAHMPWCPGRGAAPGLTGLGPGRHARNRRRGLPHRGERRCWRLQLALSTVPTPGSRGSTPAGVRGPAR
ncbi:hypothetical protein QJS66_17375 [Kocuria rhizophila]|nr:hypothetical protein QJS66_17375 [Kocuria rhizophila]